MLQENSINFGGNSALLCLLMMMIGLPDCSCQQFCTICVLVIIVACTIVQYSCAVFRVARLQALTVELFLVTRSTATSRTVLMITSIIIITKKEAKKGGRRRIGVGTQGRDVEEVCVGYSV